MFMSSTLCLDAFRHLCAKERNLLLTELAWRKIPKDKDEQMILGIPRGSPKEEDLHRLRYAEVRLYRYGGVRAGSYGNSYQSSFSASPVMYDPLIRVR